jgi:hypothetical protein
LGKGGKIGFLQQKRFAELASQLGTSSGSVAKFSSLRQSGRPLPERPFRFPTRRHHPVATNSNDNGNKSK